MPDDFRTSAGDKCDFCHQPFTEERYPIPEEAGEWTCRECLTRWGKEERRRTSVRPVTGGISRKVAHAPRHVRAGLDAYRAALNRREDWHGAVWAAIEAAIEAKERDGE